MQKVVIEVLYLFEIARSARKLWGASCSKQRQESNNNNENNKPAKTKQTLQMKVVGREMERVLGPVSHRIPRKNKNAVYCLQISALVPEIFVFEK